MYCETMQLSDYICSFASLTYHSGNTQVLFKTMSTGDALLFENLVMKAVGKADTVYYLVKIFKTILYNHRTALPRARWRD